MLVDPPKCGLSEDAVRRIVASHEHIMWISCNPEALVKDLQSVMAIAPSLRVQRFAFFDHFPYTKHVEVGVYLCKCRIGIVGGGIGGLALAVALKQRGIDCRVFERDSSFDERSQGYGLTLQQGARTIRDLDLSSALEVSSIYSPSHFIFDHEGQAVAFWGPSRLFGENEKKKAKAKHNVQISRQALRRGLFDACEELVTWNARVSTVSQRTGDHAIIHFDGECPDYVCDAVVGCDGIFSRVRRCIVDDALNYLGIIVILGIFDSEPYPLCKTRIVQMTDGETRVFMMPFSKNAEKGHQEKSMWQLTFPVTETEAKALADGRGKALRAEALRRCGAWHDQFPLYSLILTTLL